ncbi:MAG TPA: gamma-glutamyl-gamma-aminobutyrate hydrolase family protein [Chloroflexota bacterium]
MRPLIGLTIGPSQAEPSYLRLRSTYSHAIEVAGGLPVLVPPLDESAALVELLQRLDAIVLPGGLDVDPSEYGEDAHPLTEVNRRLDDLELAVARLAARSQLPTLGICRGQQLINVALGGSLVQHIEGHQQPGARSDLAHSIRVAADSRLAEIIGTGMDVNTHHHQAVGRVAPGLKAVAWAEDGTIEGLESERHAWLLAVQFHPEDLVGFHEPSQRLFGALVEAAKGRLSPIP